MILPSDDPFDAPDFNTVEYINTRFPAEQSLHHIDDVLEEMRLKIASTDDQIRTVVRSLTNVDQDGRASLLNAQEAIAELFTRFQDIKVRAGESEQRVKEITRDIKQLDTAKRNLTTSITTLKPPPDVGRGSSEIASSESSSRYGEIATFLQGVMNVLEHLKCYKTYSSSCSFAHRFVKHMLSGIQNSKSKPTSIQFCQTHSMELLSFHVKFTLVLVSSDLFTEI
nr:vacuolar protein sorting-associated protein 53 homolog [Cherax quadricarinatus]